MSTVDLSRFSFSGGENAAPIDDLTRLPAEDRERLVLAGIDVNDRQVSGAFMQLNHAGVHCETRRERPGAHGHPRGPQEVRRAAALLLAAARPGQGRLHPHGPRAPERRLFRAGAQGRQISEPVQSCMFIKGHGAGQSIHNIVVVEEGAELHILGGCATAHEARDAAHLGITEYYVEKGGKLTFTMIHNWGDSTTVRPRSAGRVEAGGEFQNNYILLKPVGDLQMYPLMELTGNNAVARFNSVIVAPAGSYVDCGNRIELNAPDTRGEVISRVLTTGGTVINRGYIGAAAAPAKGHLECKGLIMGGGRIHAIPELNSNQDGVELSHEAAVGKIAQEEIEYLMARGLDEDEAASTIVRGFLNVEIMGLPAPLKKAMDEQIALLETGHAM